jgi:hypothetical protein
VAIRDLEMTAPKTTSTHRVQMAVDCECGTSVEACDEDELFDELLEHIAAAHEMAMRQEPAAMLVDAHDAWIESAASHPARPRIEPPGAQRARHGVPA